MKLRQAISLDTLIAVILCHAAIGIAQSQPQLPESCGPIVTKLMSTTPEQRVEEFVALDLDTQYITYICAMRYVHPRIIELSIPLAERGAEAAKYLQKKLAEAPDDRSVVDIAIVFAMMQVNRTYNVNADAALRTLLERRLTAVSPEFTLRAQDLLTEFGK
jgi:hypothetical protein